MTGHDYMMQARRIELKIRRISLQIAELESCLLPQGIRYDKDKVQTSPEDQLSRITSRITDLEKQRDRLMRERAQLILEIQDLLDQLESEQERIVLEAYYLSRMSMMEISEMISYSIAQTYRFRARFMRRRR